jgi:hypothetical protein
MNDMDDVTTNMHLFSVRNSSYNYKIVWAQTPEAARTFAAQRGFIRSTHGSVVQMSVRDKFLREQPRFYKVFKFLSAAKLPCYVTEWLDGDNHCITCQFAPSYKILNQTFTLPKYNPIVINV